MAERTEPFTIEEKVYAVTWALSQNNREESRCLFQQKYDKEPPPANHIKFWSKKLLETGSFVPRRSSSHRVGLVLHQLKTTKKTWSNALWKIRVHPFAPLHLPILPELLHVSKIRRRRWQTSLILWNNGGFEPQWSRFYKKNSVFWWVSSDAFQRCLLLGCQGKLYKQIYVQKYYSNLKIFRQWPFL